MRLRRTTTRLFLLTLLAFPASGWAWHDETHISIAKVAGYDKWFNPAGADMTKTKAGDIERKNHFVNNLPTTTVTPAMVIEQVDRYNNPDDLAGHLYGAILGSIREYRTTNLKGKYAEYHLAFCAHYVGDLSQPLHNTMYNVYNYRNHIETDGIINDDVLDNLSKNRVYPIDIQSEDDLAREVARIANLSMRLGHQLEEEGRMLSKEEAYQQISHSASMFKGILKWLGK